MAKCTLERWKEKRFRNGSPVTKGVAKEVVVAMGRGGWGRQISGTIAPALYPFHGEEGQGETCTVPKISLLRRPRRSIR
ncbi:hypothetical protein BHE74_00059113 [Ensete ventricosum]|nr:hypothetical protein BHE74_00059113 [Ensete ventricosum]RZR83881.1 hypothetical protein BHM03_00010624 [Ensete ventricosum]